MALGEIRIGFNGFVGKFLFRESGLKAVLETEGAPGMYLVIGLVNLGILQR